jgi:hypothetical protein
MRAPVNFNLHLIGVAKLGHALLDGRQLSFFIKRSNRLAQLFLHIVSHLNWLAV